MISDTILVEWWWSLQSANTCLLNNQTIEQPRVELNNKYHIIVPLHCLCPCLSFEFIWLLLFIYFGVVSAQAKPLCVSFISVKLFVFIVVHCICHCTSYILMQRTFISFWDALFYPTEIHTQKTQPIKAYITHTVCAFYYSLLCTAIHTHTERQERLVAVP